MGGAKDSTQSSQSGHSSGLSSSSSRDERAEKRKLQDFMDNTNKRLKFLEEENKSLQEEVEKLKKQLITSNNDKSYNQSSERRNNLIISGLEKISEKSNPNQAKAIVNTFLKEKLKISENLAFSCEIIIPKVKENTPPKKTLIKCKFADLADSNKLVPSFVSDLQSIAVDKSSVPEEKIWNGAKSDPIPFIVSLQWPVSWGWDHFCGGTLIAPNRILTAYHCFDPEKNTDTRFRAVLGTTINQEPGQQVEFQLEHIKRDEFMLGAGLGESGTVYYANDNIVIQLPSSVNVDNETVSTVCLAGGQVSADKYYAVGWGRHNCKEGSSYLRYAEAQVLDDQTCKKVWREKSIFDDITLYKQTCSSFKQADGSDTPIYSGDSGGPLVAVVNGKPVQIGLASFVAEIDKCINLNVPPIFSKVSDHQAFIKKHAPEAAFC